LVGHLKTGLAYLGDNYLVVDERIDLAECFSGFELIRIPAIEAYAANCIRVNDFVLVPAGHPRTRKAIENAGFSVLECAVSEFQKLDGGLSCLSLRF